MENVSRPLIALLVASVAFLAVWMVALKPSSSGSGSSGSGGTTAYQSAIDKAHQAVAASAASSVAHGGTVAESPGAAKPATPPAATSAAAAPAGAATAVTPATTAHAAATPRTHATPPVAHQLPATPVARIALVERALRSKKVLALLFYNGAAADDRAVKQELASVPAHTGHVVKLAVPLSELAQYTVVTNQVPVSSSPTLVLIDRTQHASTIVGFADRFEISQRVDDALVVK